MSRLPISGPVPGSRETLYSYLARLAAAWRTEAPAMVYDMGTSFKKLLDQHEEALETFASWANLSPEVMAELLSWTGLKSGNVRTLFRGEVYVSRALRNPVMRGCPICLRQDAAKTDRAAHELMVLRGDWQFRDVMICVEHQHSLVPLWQNAALRDRFDIGARLEEISDDILSGAFDQAARIPSAYDYWLDQRLQDGSDTTWLADHSVFAVTTMCRYLGKAVAMHDGTEDDREHAAGFEIMKVGQKEIRKALDQIAAMATEAQDEPRKIFGPLYTSLNRDYLNEPDFDPFRKILRECILDHWPLAGGDVVLGEALPQRRLHSLRTAALESGVGAKVLEQFLIEAGAIVEHDPAPKVVNYLMRRRMLRFLRKSLPWSAQSQCAKPWARQRWS
ncbi:MAG: TniQ family protein [Pelagibaca sp.]